MSIFVQGYASFSPRGFSLDPIRYKTSVFSITNGTSLSEVYDHFNNNPAIYWLRANSIVDTWGDPIIGPKIGTQQIDLTWERTSLPTDPIVLKWDITQAEREDGTGTSFLFDITTPTNNLRHYDG